MVAAFESYTDRYAKMSIFQNYLLIVSIQSFYWKKIIANSKKIKNKNNNNSKNKAKTKQKTKQNKNKKNKNKTKKKQPKKHDLHIEALVRK